MLEDTTVNAIERGLAFLETLVTPDGGWPSRRYGNFELTGPSEPECPPAPFVAAVGALCLGACDHPRAEALVERARRFLLSRIEYPGVWRYWSGLPPDQDDTALCSLVAPAHYWLMMGRNLDVILSHRDTEGRFFTWFSREGPWKGTPNDIDSVVNANVVARLGDCAETRGAQRWLGSLIEKHREADSAPSYVFELDLHVALVRASEIAPPAFARLRPVLGERILRSRDEDGSHGDIRRTAQAVSALLSLGYDGGVDPVRSSLERLLEAQAPHGGWPECLVWRAPQVRIPGGGRLRLGFASEALTTATCIEALARSLRRP